MANIIKRFARHRDYMRLTKFERVSGFDAEWKFLRRPAKHCLPNLAPLWADWNFGANCSDVVAVGIYQRDVNVAVYFNFQSNDATSEREPLIFSRDAFLLIALYFISRNSGYRDMPHRAEEHGIAVLPGWLSWSRSQKPWIPRN